MGIAPRLDRLITNWRRWRNTKNTDQVTGEEDTPSSSNATLFTPDSQPKMEMDSIPSSSRTAKNNF
uniref:Uncharacterized protein n=1 Tax=Cucumis melo TaxID=3656 RepID=A0A9I9DW64_CUCME